MSLITQPNEPPPQIGSRLSDLGTQATYPNPKKIRKKRVKYAFNSKDIVNKNRDAQLLLRKTWVAMRRGMRGEQIKEFVQDAFYNRKRRKDQLTIAEDVIQKAIAVVGEKRDEHVKEIECHFRMPAQVKALLPQNNVSEEIRYAIINTYGTPGMQAALNSR